MGILADNSVITTFNSKLDFVVSISAKRRFLNEMKNYCKKNETSPTEEFLKIENEMFRKLGYKNRTDFAMREHDLKNYLKMLNLKINQKTNKGSFTKELTEVAIAKWKRNGHKFEYLQENDVEMS